MPRSNKFMLILGVEYNFTIILREIPVGSILSNCDEIVPNVNP